VKKTTVNSANANWVISQSKTTNSQTVVSTRRALGGAENTRTLYTDEFGCDTMAVHGLGHAWSGVARRIPLFGRVPAEGANERTGPAGGARCAPAIAVIVVDAASRT
jgi:hypothetical protein